MITQKMLMMNLIQHLAAMENEIKPKVLQTVHNLTKEYNKLIKYQKEKLDCLLNSQNIFFIKRKKL